MAEKFDEFSKHLAKKHSRRGAFKLFGAGIIGAAAATAFGQAANATPSVNQTYPHYNQTFPNYDGFPDFNGNPKFNAVNQALAQVADEVKKIESKFKLKIFFPWFK